MLRTVSSSILRPPYAATGSVAPSPPFVVLQDKEDVDALRRAGRVAREVLEFACSLAVAGRSTDSIDAEVHAAILRRNVYPAPLNYRGFPKVTKYEWLNGGGGKWRAGVGRGGGQGG